MIRHVFLAALLLSSPAFAQATHPVTSIAMHGDPKYPSGFAHFDYVNPDAPKGGALRMSALETFDSFNPYIIKGVPADGIGNIYVTLMEQSGDEPFSEYAGLAQTVAMPPDRSSITYTIRPQATWDDRRPVTAEDVKWSFDTLMKDGSPFYRGYYADVAKVEILGPRIVKFTFKNTQNREMPMIVGQLPILPKHYWTAKDHDFTQTTLMPPPGDGPYRIVKVDPGRSVTYGRVKDWWGKDLPPYKGRFNFDTISYDYYRDADVALEAFLGDGYDFRWEMAAKKWATGYASPAVRDRRIAMQVVKNGLPQGMQAFVYNIRRPVFQNQAVRQALDYAFDFDWSNKQFAYNAYIRNTSYFDNSPMAAPHRPPTGKARDVLLQFKDRLPPGIFTTRYEPPKTDGTGNDRANLRVAIKLLDGAGFKVGADGLRHDPKTGKPLAFEFLTNGSNTMFDRWIMPFIANLKKIGVTATFRVVDAAQYVNRVNAFDYDMTVMTFAQSLSPGNEQREYWKSDRAGVQGSRNYIGLENPVIDRLVEMIIASPTEDDLIARCQALDYVLLDGNYVIPNWNIPAWREAYWDKFGRPAKQAPYAMGVTDTWWAR